MKKMRYALIGLLLCSFSAGTMARMLYIKNNTGKTIEVETQKGLFKPYTEWQSLAQGEEKKLRVKPAAFKINTESGTIYIPTPKDGRKTANRYDINNPTPKQLSESPLYKSWMDMTSKKRRASLKFYFVRGWRRKKLVEEKLARELRKRE